MSPPKPALDLLARSSEAEGRERGRSNRGEIGGRRATEPAISEIPAELWSLARAEDEHIRLVLAACNGNKSEAARRLRITRRTLQRKLRIRDLS
jgi:ActR/RegA family two-component response regulator